MVRISVDLVNDAYQFVNTVKQREICLRNLQIPTIENLGVTKVRIFLRFHPAYFKRECSFELVHSKKLVTRTLANYAF